MRNSSPFGTELLRGADKEDVALSVASFSVTPVLRRKTRMSTCQTRVQCGRGDASGLDPIKLEPNL
jgi:hypothetical protein